MTAVAVGPRRRGRLRNVSGRPALAGRPEGEGAREGRNAGGRDGRGGRLVAGLRARRDRLRREPGRRGGSGRRGGTERPRSTPRSRTRHVRSLLVLGDGTLVAGTSDHGLVVAIAADGKVRTLHDFARPEVTALAARDPAGRSWPWRRPWRCRRSRSSGASPASPAVPAASSAGRRVRRRTRFRRERSPSRRRRRPCGRRPLPASSREGNAEVVLIAAGRLRGARLDPPGGDGLRGAVGRRTRARSSSRPALAAASTA